MKYKGVISIIFSGALLCACNMSPGVDIEAEQAALRAAADAYHEAAQAVDIDSLVDLYANDGLILAPNTAEEEGLEGARNFATAFSQIPGFGVRFDDVRVEVAANGDMGYTLADAVISIEGPDGEPVEDQVRDFHLWKKQDGEWRVAIDIWNSELPLPGIEDTSEAEDALNGVWKIEEFTTESGQNPGTFTDLPPNVYIFTDGHYSIMSIGDDRPDFQPGDDVSDEDTIAAFNSFIGQSGSYEVSGSTITVQIIAARVPGVVGGTGEIEYRLEGDTLYLTQTQPPGSGNVNHRKLVRLE